MLFSQENPDVSSKYLPYALEEIYPFDNFLILDFHPLDLESDGNDEWLILQREVHIKYSIRFYRKFLHQVIEQKNYPDQNVTFNNPHTLFFRTPEGEPRICITIRKSNKAILQVFDMNLKLISQIPVAEGADKDGSGSWDGWAFPIAAKDMNEDGYPEVIIKVSSGHDEQPRGVWAIDIKRGVTLWRFPTGTDITDITVRDLDNDGDVEILFGGSAPSNGASINGTDDDHSYLGILDHNGERMWLREIAGTFSGCYPTVADLRGDGQLKIISIDRSRGAEDELIGSITLRDAKTHIIENVFPGIMVPYKLLISDLDFDGRKEIIVGTMSMTPEVFVFTDSLILQKRIPLSFGVREMLVEDLNKDGVKEIVISNGSTKNTLVLNNKFKEMASLDLGGKLHTVNQGFDKPKLLAILIPEERINFYELHRSNPIERYPIDFLLIGFIMGAIILSLILLSIKFFRPKFADSSIIYQLLDRIPVGILWLDRKEKVRYCNSTAAEIFGIKGSLPIHRAFSENPNLNKIKNYIYGKKIIKDKNRTEWMEQKFKIGVNEFQTTIFTFKKMGRSIGFIIIMNDITARSNYKKAILWSGLSQKLAHEIKNPLSTILLTLQRLETAYQEDKVKHKEKYDKYTQSAIEEIERLRKVTDGFMKFTKIKPPDLKITPVESVVKKIEARTREWLPEKISFDVQSEKDLPEMSVDMDQIHALFFNLFDNAVKATDGRGRLTLRVSMVEWIKPDEKDGKETRVQFEISDTGCGITKEKLGNLFEPYFSLREGGTGLGLTICKRIVEDHNGSISVVSKLDIGMTVRVEIPAVDNEQSA